MSLLSANRLNSSFKLQGKMVRRSFRRFRQSRQFPLTQAPILFANAFPKSGTHLLTQILAGFSKFGPAVVSGLPAIVNFEGDTGRQRTNAEILRDLGRLLPGDIGYGHLHAQSDIVNVLCSARFATYFILRDPRDVVVSHVHYITQIEPNHIHHDYYKNELKSLDDRIRISITGRDDLSAGISFPNIYERFMPYLGWLQHSDVLVLHFEDFITKRQQILSKVYDHATERGFTTSYDKPTVMKILNQSIDPERSPTFRSGKIGSWRDSFNENTKAQFKQVCGDLLIRLGYENDNAW
jgi:hypothetical protein